MPYKDPSARAAYLAKYRAANRERLQTQQRAWNAAHIDQVRSYQRRKHARLLATDPDGLRRKMRANHLARMYGLTQDQYAKMAASQQFRCAICGEPDERLHVDHEHASRRIRGLLCGRCNRAVGLFRDDPSLIRSAAAYLELR